MIEQLDRRWARNDPVALRFHCRIVAFLLVVGVGFAGSGIAATQEKEEIVTAVRMEGNKLLVIAAGIELSPDGTFAHESGDLNVVFQRGEPVSFKGTDEEIHDVARAEVRGDRLVLYLEQGHVRNKATPSATLSDGVWGNRNGAQLIIEDGKIAKVKGLQGGES